MFETTCIYDFEVDLIKFYHLKYKTNKTQLPSEIGSLDKISKLKKNVSIVSMIELTVAI